VAAGDYHVVTASHTTPSGQQIPLELACRAAIPDARHKEAAWQLLTGDHLGPESLTTVARGFTQPEQAGLLAPYAGRYLAELEKIWATQGGHLRVRLSEPLFPYPAASPELLAQIDEFLTATPRDPGLARVLAERRDAVQRAQRSRALARRRSSPG
jgi:aminopeptidase N